MKTKNNKKDALIVTITTTFIFSLYIVTKKNSGEMCMFVIMNKYPSVKKENMQKRKKKKKETNKQKF